MRKFEQKASHQTLNTIKNKKIWCTTNLSVSDATAFER